MPRANRYHIAGLAWHITHRCHNKDFLFRFQTDRIRYRFNLWKACKRYGLCLLNYMVTSNHIHLIVFDSGESNVIENSMQYAQGRIAQDFNRRKNRFGAFWQDRYHATAIQCDQHLRRCMTYVDMNMVRAGVVDHPKHWRPSGYSEIQNPPNKYKLLHIEKLIELMQFSTHAELASWQEEQIQYKIQNPSQRESFWSEAVAVGDADYLAQVSRRLGFRARHLEIMNSQSHSILQKTPSTYRRKP